MLSALTFAFALLSTVASEEKKYAVTIHQAETAFKVNGAEVSCEIGAATCREGSTGQYVDFGRTDGQYIEWQLDALVSNKGSIRFHYALGYKGRDIGENRPMQITVNGLVYGKVDLPNTDGFNVWSDSIPLQVNNFKDNGVNVITMLAVCDAQLMTDPEYHCAPHIDYMEVTVELPPPPPPPVVVIPPVFFMTTPTHMQVIPLCIGKIATFNVDVYDGNIDDTVKITFLNKDKFPPGSKMGPHDYSLSDPGKFNKVRRVFSLSSESLTQLSEPEICFSAYDSTLPKPLETPTRCIKLTIRHPPRIQANFETIHGHACSEVKFTVGANDEDNEENCEAGNWVDGRCQSADEVSIFALEDGLDNTEVNIPGVPNGAMISPQVCPPAKCWVRETVEAKLNPALALEPFTKAQCKDGCADVSRTTQALCSMAGQAWKKRAWYVRCNPVERVFTWTPETGQAGKSYKVCFIARDNKDNCEKGGYYSLNSVCVTIHVAQPAPVWTAPTPADMSNYKFHVGCTTAKTFVVTDPWYAMKVREIVVPASKNFPVASVTTKSVGAFTTPCKPFSGGIDRANRQCTREFVWKPSRGQEGQSYTFCYDATEDNEGMCAAKMHQYDLNFPSRLDAPNMKVGEEYLASGMMGNNWGPGNQGAGAKGQYLAGRDHQDNVMVVLPKRCINIEVRRCRYCINEGDTLMTLNKQYHLSSNWMQLWNANGNDDHDSMTVQITNPDILAATAAESNKPINVGPVYEVQHGDNMMAIASRFHTTVKQLLFLNPDLAKVPTTYQDVEQSRELMPGQMLCVMPCTNQMATEFTFKGDPALPGGDGHGTGDARYAY